MIKTMDEKKLLEAISQMMDEKLNPINDRLIKLELTLENETNRNIKVIAEGHSNLDRKLDQALEMEKRDEMTQIRLNVIESEVKIIKHQLHMA